MRPPDRAKGELPRYAIWTEGVDADGDGLLAEDGAGGVDPDLNFPYRWPEFDRHAGQYQLSEPESMALARFVFDHPRLFAVYTLGRHDNLVNVPDSRAKDITGRQPLLLDEGDAPLWGELAKLYDKWFMKPIPPAGVTINLPLGEATKNAWANPNSRQ